MSTMPTVVSLGLKTTNYWVNLLRTLPPYEIGVIKISARIFQSASLFHSFVEEVHYLTQEAGIILPIVVESRKNSLTLYQEKLARALEKRGIATVACPSSLVHLQPSLRKTWGVDTIFTAPIIDAILCKRIPLIVAAGVSPSGETTAIPGLLLARELVYAIHAKKLILVGHSPICHKNGECITDILSEKEWQHKIHRKEITPDTARRVTFAFDILSRLGPGHSVQITRPQSNKTTTSTGLLEELLGNGSGTYIALPPQITAYPLDAIDHNWLQQIVNEAFLPQGRQLKTDYFSLIHNFQPIVYLDSLRKGGAIVYPLEKTMYMCKLFTRQDYEGIGIGTTVIQTIFKHFGGLCWRTSRTNTQNHAFYERLVNTHKGTIETTNRFYIYFIGEAATHAKTLAHRIDALPSSFVPL